MFSMLRLKTGYTRINVLYVDTENLTIIVVGQKHNMYEAGCTKSSIPRTRFTVSEKPLIKNSDQGFSEH